MYVNSRVNVVNQIPTRVIWILVHYKIITAGPAPVRGFVPVPIGDFEKEPTWEPKTVMVWIEPLDAVAIRRAEMCEVTVLEWGINVETLVVRRVVPIPVVVANVRNLVHVPALIPLNFPLHVLVSASLRGRRNAPGVPARRIGALLPSAPMCVATMLRICSTGQYDGRCENEPQVFFHGDTPPMRFVNACNVK